MALRRQLSNAQAIFVDPILGVNLQDAEEDLKAGEARLMQNCIFSGGTRKRLGSTNLTASSLGSFMIRGGHKFYEADTTSTRLIAYDTNISSINGAGAETVINSSMTSDQDTTFYTWPIQDAVYIMNNSDVLRKINNAGTFSTVSGTAIPTGRQVIGYRDRMLAITNDGIERTDPRVDNVWSTNSGWATFRPDRVGRFVAMAPYTFEGISDVEPVTTSVIALQQNAYYMLSGNDLGDDVTSATASSGENARILRLNDNVGTSSPNSVVNVPGVGLFWFTSDLNVYWLPQNSIVGRFVGDKIRSNNSTAGIESTNRTAIAQVWMQYFNRFLILSIPTGSDAYPTTQFWMDMRALSEDPQARPVWYGPMTGQSISRAWRETQAGDNALYAGEGNSATGAFVYELFSTGTYTDAVGTADNAISMTYQTYFKSFGRAEREKYLRAIQFNMNSFSGTATADVLDLAGSVASSVSIAAI